MIRMTQGEFDRFWDEAIGDNWYIDEWDGPNDEIVPPADTPIAFTFLYLGWQGNGAPEPNPWIQRRDLQHNNWVDATPIVNRWRTIQDSDADTIIVTVRIPGAVADELGKWLDTNGGIRVEQP